MLRWTAVLTSAAAFTVFAFVGSLPAAAAMPVAGHHAVASDSLQVQAKA